MTQTNVQTAKEVCFAAKESTFGVLPTMKPLIIEADSWEGEQNRTPLEDMDTSPLLLDEQLRIDGVFEGTAKLKAKLKPYASQITSTAPATQPALFDLLECAMGGMQVGAGSAITAGTTSQVTVSSDTGFAIGQVVGISGSSDNQLAVVETKPGAGVVTFWPNLASAVTSGTLVNSYNAFVTETASSTFSIQHGYPDSSNEQQELRGCKGKFKLALGAGSLAMVEYDVEAATGQQGALSLSSSVQTNPLASGGHAVKNALLYIQTSATTTRTNYCVEEFGFEFDPAQEWTPCLTGTENKDGVMRVKGRGVAKLMLKIKADSAEITTWAARTVRRVLFAIPNGSGTTKRWIYVYLPKAVLARSPKQTKAGGRLLYDLEFHTQINNSAAANSLAGTSALVGAL